MNRSVSAALFVAAVACSACNGDDDGNLPTLPNTDASVTNDAGDARATDAPISADTALGAVDGSGDEADASAADGAPSTESGADANGTDAGPDAAASDGATEGSSASLSDATSDGPTE